jgi:NADH-quinone oxidoreductase subunit E
MELSAERLRELDKLLARYPTKQAAVMPALRLVQDQLGSISDEAIAYVADLLGVPAAHVTGVASFYTMYNRRPVGRHHIQVCQNLSCSLMGAESILEHLEKKLGIKAGETTTDQRFTLSRVECLGSCGTAPVMQVNLDYHENLSAEKVDSILEGLK